VREEDLADDGKQLVNINSVGATAKYSFLEQLKQTGRLQEFACRTVEEVSDLQDNQKRNLQQFFNSALAHDILLRSSNMASMLSLMEQEGYVVARHTPR
jgi:hypothetical protein